jgi:hypothetical protein
MSEIISIIRSIIPIIWKPLKWVHRKVRILAFRVKNKKPPLNETKAIQIAHSILSGHIDNAFSFININSNNIYIALSRRSSAADHDVKIHLLEQIGDTYRQIWNSETLWCKPQLEVKDINGDGIHELIFIEESFGSGGGTICMSVYSQITNKPYKIREDYWWSDASGPHTPTITFEPEPENKDLRHAMVQYARAHGLLKKPELVDFDDPKFAEQRWHKYNGNKTKGPVILHFYNGKPPYIGTDKDSLNTKDILWIACFKGPLVGYLKSKDKHFIAYSPSDRYDWITCLAYSEDTLWFSSSGSGLFSFKLDQDLVQEKGYLNFFTQFRGKKLPEFNQIAVVKDLIILNNSIKIPIGELKS